MIYSVASIEPVIIDPTSFYVIPKSYVYYNGNDTSLTGSQLGTKILQGIDEYNKNGQTNRFNGRIDGSNFGFEGEMQMGNIGMAQDMCK